MMCIQIFQVSQAYLEILVFSRVAHNEKAWLNKRKLGDPACLLSYLELWNPLSPSACWFWTQTVDFLKTDWSHSGFYAEAIRVPFPKSCQGPLHASNNDRLNTLCIVLSDNKLSWRNRENPLLGSQNDYDQSWYLCGNLLAFTFYHCPHTLL